jgi:hypothetical protein
MSACRLSGERRRNWPAHQRSRVGWNRPRLGPTGDAAWGQTGQ